MSERVSNDARMIALRFFRRFREFEPITTRIRRFFHPLSLSLLLFVIMGGNTTFNRSVKDIKIIFDVAQLPNAASGMQRIVFHDVSYHCHSVQAIAPDLGFRIFKLDPGNHDELDRLVQRYGELLHESINQWAAVHADANEVCLVAEDTSNKSDRRAAKLVSGKASKLNQGIRKRFLSASTADHGHGQRMISNNMGRPPFWFMSRVYEWMRSIQDFPFNLVTCVKGFQADDYVIARINQLKASRQAWDISVVATDRDFIAFSQADRILFKENGLKKSLVRQHVLDKLELSSEQLFIAYLLSGCDDVATTLNGVGFYTALRIVKQATNVDSWRELAETQSIQMGKPEWPQKLQQLWTEIVQLRTKHRGPFQPMVEHEPRRVDIPHQSLLRQFLDESDTTNKLRREGLKRLYDNRQELQPIPHGHGVNRREHRARVAQGRAKKFTTLFLTPNHYELLRPANNATDDDSGDDHDTKAGEGACSTTPAATVKKPKRQGGKGKEDRKKPPLTKRPRNGDDDNQSPSKTPKMSDEAKQELRDAREAAEAAVNALMRMPASDRPPNWRRDLEAATKAVDEVKKAMADHGVRMRGSKRDFAAGVKVFPLCTRTLGGIERIVQQGVKDMGFVNWIHECVSVANDTDNALRQRVARRILELIQVSLMIYILQQ